MALSESKTKEYTKYRPEVRDGEGEEGIEVLLLKFGDELAKRGDERRLRLEFMEGGEKAGERERERGQSRTERGCLVPCPLLPIRFQGLTLGGRGGDR